MGAGNFVTDNCRVIPTRLTTTALTSCITASGYTQLVGVRIVNYHATLTPTIDFRYYNAVNAVSYVMQNNYVMAVAQSLWFPFDAFALYESDQIFIGSSVANAVDTFLFIAEIPGRSQ